MYGGIRKRLRLRLYTSCQPKPSPHLTPRMLSPPNQPLPHHAPCSIKPQHRSGQCCHSCSQECSYPVSVQHHRDGRASQARRGSDASRRRCVAGCLQRLQCSCHGAPADAGAGEAVAQAAVLAPMRDQEADRVGDHAPACEEGEGDQRSHPRHDRRWCC